MRSFDVQNESSDDENEANDSFEQLVGVVGQTTQDDEAPKSPVKVTRV